MMEGRTKGEAEHTRRKEQGATGEAREGHTREQRTEWRKKAEETEETRKTRGTERHRDQRRKIIITKVNHDDSQQIKPLANSDTNDAVLKPTES